MAGACLTSGKQTMPLSEFLLSGWVSITQPESRESDEPATGGRHPHRGESGCYREAEVLPSSLVHDRKAGIDLQHTYCSPPHPPPPLSPSPANGGINPCRVLWDGRPSLPTALHFIRHWMLTHKAGGMTVSAAFTRLFPQSWMLYISNMQPL